MTHREFTDLVKACVEITRRAAPHDTGNLEFNAIKFKFIGKNEAHIYVDEAIAPYMPYTNEPWVSSWWNGKKNPNLYWFDRVAQEIRFFIEGSIGASSSQTSAGEGLDIAVLANRFQNKTGDYFPEDVWTHSSFISRADDVAAMLENRIKLIGGIT